MVRDDENCSPTKSENLRLGKAGINSTHQLWATAGIIVPSQDQVPLTSALDPCSRLPCYWQWQATIEIFHIAPKCHYVWGGRALCPWLGPHQYVLPEGHFAEGSLKPGASPISAPHTKTVLE